MLKQQQKIFSILRKIEIQGFLRTHKAKISGSKAELALRAFEINQYLFTDQRPVNHDDDHNDVKSTSVKDNIEEKVPDYKDILSGWTSNLQEFTTKFHIKMLNRIFSTVVIARTTNRK